MKKKHQVYYWIIFLGILYNFILLARSQKNPSNNITESISEETLSNPVSINDFRKL
ncbi:hypothetical protein Belba_2997 [Belliella baltica DSM 15883]|uniref:Uncharacterized protein n=1 Tax=Belliella baltica (strain DSM 15883 / CIP 108006 / LMG 21964 / BA134) TaxID=866536 RepID=I3Z8E8_BELBD|nr:hypothetical protein Belba_2997 [Belliella baltica DSM 15883]